MFNCPEMLEAIFACFKAGCGAVPINFRLHPREFAFIVHHSESKAVVITSEFNEQILEVRDQIPLATNIITVSGAQAGLLDYESLVKAEEEQFDDAEVDPTDLAWLFYTSGTTGMPKGAMLTHRNLMAMTLNFFADMCPDCGPEDATLHAAPLSHGSGLYALPNVAKAAAHIIPESKSFDAELFLQLIEEFRITNVFAAPTMLKRVIDSPAIDKFDLSSLKSVIYGGAPMLLEDLLKAMEKLGPCLVQLYGMGETPMTISFLSHRDHVLNGSPEQMARLKSAGCARTNVEVKIFDPDDNELPPNQMGEIVTRSDLVMKGYWRNPNATAETLSSGWLHTGDMGSMDEHGYVFIMDRSKDMIISGGENIYPREIEEVIVQHPAVREVAVIGVPDLEWGEAIKAVVSLVPGEEVTEKQLIDFCRDHIASYKKPKSVDFVNEIPKNNNGKIVKKELREKYWQGKESRVV
jgi:acyl-CoA synthetase (AMP-forming)/AMP-acid ligase II